MNTHTGNVPATRRTFTTEPLPPVGTTALALMRSHDPWHPESRVVSVPVTLVEIGAPSPVTGTSPIRFVDDDGHAYFTSAWVWTDVIANGRRTHITKGR